MPHQQEESKRVKVYGDRHFKEYAKTHPVPPAFERQVATREVTFTCTRCHLPKTEWHYPGPTPRYCAECGPVVAREKAASRARSLRERRKQQAMNS